nr:MAG TPA: hypothetical protein [Caudoviricetes sp.]
MTRKRFIKLLMATRTPRNDAIRIADEFRLKGWPYNAALRATLWFAFRQLFEVCLEGLSSRTCAEAQSDG